MKKLLLLIVAIICVLNSSAQGINSPQGQSATISIDILSIRLNKLQHDYDFMYCDYELHKLLMDLKDLSHSVGRSSNAVIINYYNGIYDRGLYNSYVSDYEAACGFLDSLKEKIEAVQIAVGVKIMSSEFSDAELNVLSAGFKTIQQVVTSVEASLNYYNVSLKAYRSKK